MASDRKGPVIRGEALFAQPWRQGAQQVVFNSLNAEHRPGAKARPRLTAPSATAKPNLPAWTQRRQPRCSPTRSRGGDTKIASSGRHRRAARADVLTASQSATKRYWSN